MKDELRGEEGGFYTPAFAKSYNELERSFDYEINHNPVMRENASDYSLWQIGIFDDETGEFIPKLIKGVTGHTVKRKEIEE